MSRSLALRSARWADVWWLLGAGLDPRRIGEQYSVWESPLQVVVAPARAVLAPLRPHVAAVIEVDGRRAGYIGPNPLSGNIEYFLSRWARGGLGRRLIVAYLGTFRRDDRARRFFVAYKNDRSRAALLGAIEQLGWTEHTIDARRFGWVVTVPAAGPLGRTGVSPGEEA